MHESVIALVVAHNGGATLEATLSAVAAEHPATLVVVDTGSSDNTLELLNAANPSRLVSAKAETTFAEAVELAVSTLGPAASDDDLLWILHDDSAPMPGALDAMLAVREQNPSVSILGPKQVEWDRPNRIVEFGLTTTFTGVKVRLGHQELDQAQFDDKLDVLAVGTAGMLVLRSVYESMHGFDPALEYTDDGLDFGIRTRLAGGRVVRVPAASVRHAETRAADRSAGDRATSFTAARIAQYHRQLVYASPMGLLLLWLALIPMSIGRALWQLLSKHPASAPKEVVAAVTAFFSLRTVRTSRSRRSGHSTVAYRALAGLKLRPREHRQLLQNRSDTVDVLTVERVDPTLVKVQFWGTSGVWVVLALAVFGLVLWSPLLGRSALTGGAATSLSPSVGTLWANALSIWNNQGAGISAPADAFATVLAVLGSATFWQPSLSIVVLYFVAFPIAALGAYVLAGRFVQRPVFRSLAALVWALNPILLGALAEARIPAIIAHLVLPFAAFLFLLGLSPALRRSQSMTALSGSALLSAVVVACSPIALVPIVAVWIVSLVVRWRLIPILVWFPVPMVAAIAPMAVWALRHHHLEALFVDPGTPAMVHPASNWWSALASPTSDPLLLTHLVTNARLGSIAQWLVVVPLALLMVAAVVGALSHRSRAALFATALFAACATLPLVFAGIRFAHVGAETTGLWFGTVQSIGLLGLLAAALLGFRAARSIKSVTVPIAILALLVVAAPWAIGVVRGAASVEAGTASISPAIIAADARVSPGNRTLLLEQRPGAAGRPLTWTARLVSTAGPTMDAENTAYTSRTGVNAHQAALARLTASLLTTPDPALRSDLVRLGVQSILVQGSSATSDQVRTLDSNTALDDLGTTRYGSLWRVIPAIPHQAATFEFSWPTLAVQGGLLLVFLLLAIPTSRYPRLDVESDDPLTQPSFGGDYDD